MSSRCITCKDLKDDSELIRLKCGHCFCWICINNYFISNLNSKIKCPEPLCNIFIRDSQIRSVLSEEDIEKYDSLCIGNISQTHKCLLEECAVSVVYTDPNVQYECSSCSLFNCIQCKAAHSGLSCKEFRSSMPIAKQRFCHQELERAQAVYNDKRKKIKRQILMEYDNMDLHTNDKVFHCESCNSDIGKSCGVKLQNCEHYFCKDCLVQCAERTKTIPVQCPSCREAINDREMQSILSPEQLKSYEDKCKNKAKIKLQYSFQCQTPDCDVFYETNDQIKQFQCRLCLANNCISCRAIHNNESCQTYQAKINKDINFKAIKEKIEAGELMKCPKCNNLIAKKAGCNWIQCSNCLVELCWIRKMLRWGPGGRGDTSGGCKCLVNGIPCDPECKSTCMPHLEAGEEPYIPEGLELLILQWRLHDMLRRVLS